jgi:tetratricopeptide (TPR) repeat protein
MDTQLFLDYLFRYRLLNRQQFQSLFRESSLEERELLIRLIYYSYQLFHKILQEKKAPSLETAEQTLITLFLKHYNPSVSHEITHFLQKICEEEATEEEAGGGEEKKRNETPTRMSSSPSQEKTSAGVGAFIPSPYYYGGLHRQERYRLMDTLGIGGMGKVDLALDLLLGREVALKKIKGEIRDFKKLTLLQQQRLWRFHQEAFITALLEHPHIVPLYDMQQLTSGELFFTMRKIEGKTLKTVLSESAQNQKAWASQDLLNIFFKVCDAVAYAHSKKVIHRDIKPENIMVGSFGEVYVMDWGISKFQGTWESEKYQGEIPLLALEHYDNPFQTIGGIGTMGYMAPEQAIEAALVHPQADIYSLGKILKHCFPQATGDLNAVIAKATEEKWEDRYATIPAFVEDLKRYQQDTLLSIRTYTPLEILRKWIKRNWRKLLLLLSFLGITFLLWFYFQWYQTQLQRKQFEKYYEEAQRKKEKALTFKVSFPEKYFNHLLDTLQALEQALSVIPQDTQAQKEKIQIRQELLSLACTLENYSFATYLLESFPNRSSVEKRQKQELFISIQEQKNKRLYAHQKKLAEWFVLLDQPQVNESLRSQAIFEIAKMNEPEIFEQLLQELRVGTEYFLHSKERTPRKDEFYMTLISALGRLENPQATPLLIQALHQMVEQISGLKVRPFADIQWMTTLVTALRNNKAKGVAKILSHFRVKMGQNSLFWNQTEADYKALLLEENFENPSEKNAEWYLYQGDFKREKEDWNGALEYYQKALELDPHNSFIYTNRALAYLRKQEYDQSLKNTLHALELNPNDAKAWNTQGCVYLALKQYPLAIENFNRALVCDPHYTDVYLNLGVAYNESQNLEKALEAYQQALQQSPDYAVAYFNRALLYHHQGELKKALADYNTYLLFNSLDSKAYNNRGIIHVTLGNHEKALSDYDLAIYLNPHSAEAYYNRANLKRDQEDFKGAFADYTQALQMNPRYLEAYINRGALLFKEKKMEEAQQDFEKALELNPQFSDIYFQLSLLKQEQKQSDSALEYLNKALELQPKNGIYHKSRAYYWLQKKNSAKALEDFNLALESFQDFDLYRGRGLAKEFLHQFESALDDFKKAQELDPHSILIYFNLGTCARKLGQDEQALAFFEQGLTLEVEPQALNYFTEFLLERILFFYRTQEYSKALEDIQRYEKYAPSNHPKRPQMSSMRQKLEELLKTPK